MDSNFDRLRKQPDYELGSEQYGGLEPELACSGEAADTPPNCESDIRQVFETADCQYQIGRTLFSYKDYGEALVHFQSASQENNKEPEYEH